MKIGPVLWKLYTFWVEKLSENSDNAGCYKNIEYLILWLKEAYFNITL